MNFLYSTVSLIFTCFISTVRSNSSCIGPGASSCWWYGSLDTKCNMSRIPCDTLPNECTSFFWDSFSINLNYDICDTYDDQEHLKSLCNCSKPVFVTYGYDNLKMWGQALQQAADKNNDDEWKNVKNHMSNYSCVSGLILDHLDVEPGQPIPNNMSANLKTYISSFKEKINDKQLGINIFAHELMLYYCNKTGDWINFEDINDKVDFYVLSTTYLNENCTADFKTGLAPVNGSYQFTMEKLVAVLNEAKIPKEKLIFHYSMNPVKDTMDHDLCNINYGQMCSKPDSAQNWCADTLSTYYDKGMFTQQNAMGFVTEYQDLDDPTCLCVCNQSYPGFHAILSGFTKGTQPVTCPLFDRL